MTEFQELFNMPNTLGAVDGTHISIAKPSINHPTAPGNLFYNRKGFYSINCQIVCSAKGKIIGLNPNFPGSTHDAAIWRASTINHFLKSNFLSGERNQWLLGDKGYPLQPWLMTPLMAPTTEAEIHTGHTTTVTQEQEMLWKCGMEGSKINFDVYIVIVACIINQKELQK
ncbi:unnamed protein product [Arctia plantaginis]|uniref:Putative nuclease HARBI1 n=1 Tax=Arctia plantaginis TaxID=874455 RepID=A0A8S0ZAH5_ARCPL|nr:unnamed protein product [Arctia plantaginis]